MNLVYKYVEVKTAINKTRLPDTDYSINPYFGCRFSCIYCYAMKYQLMRGIGYRWGEYIEVKKNLIRQVRRDLKKIPGGCTIGIGISTDPYQPIEAKLMMTRRVLDVLSGRKDIEISIQTKSPLVLRDIDIIGSRRDMNVGFTITTLRWDLARLLEPLAPAPISRLKAIERLSREGVETWVFIGPIMPYLNDNPEDIRDIMVRASKAGVSRIYLDNLRFRYGVRDNMVSHLDKYDQEIAAKYRRLNYDELMERYSLIIPTAEEMASELGIELENVGYRPSSK